MSPASRRIRTVAPNSINLAGRIRSSGLSSVALCTAVSGLIPAPVHASPVVFVNPSGAGQYDWKPASGTLKQLNITVDSLSQPGIVANGRIRQGWSGVSDVAFSTAGTNRVEFSLTPANRPYAVALELGSPIPSPTPTTFGTGAIVHQAIPEPGDPEYSFAEGVPVYIGVKFNGGAGDQYGWIGVVRTGFLVDAFAWGYETTPGVAISAGAGLGTCCSIGACIFTSAAECGSGTFTAGVACEPATCVTGACCIAGQCFTLPNSTACSNDGGMYQGDNTACVPNPCGVSATGACCNGTACSVSTQIACTGAYQGNGSACSADPLNPTTCCAANINGSGGLSVQDIFDFLAAYFSNDPHADFNSTGGISVQDIFDFLAAYFAGCE